MNPTTDIVARQLAAMRAELYELGLHRRAPRRELIAARLAGGGASLDHPNAEARVQQELRMGSASLPPAEREQLARVIAAASNHMDFNDDMKYTARQILSFVPWLDQENEKGREIYLRPAPGYVTMVFVDDITAATVAHMRRNGLAPAVVMESSPANFQAWVRVAQTPLSPDITTAIARDLAGQLGGDRGAAKQRQFGRLAGFTNRKDSRIYTEGPHAGLHPFVRLREATGASAPAGPALVRAAEERVREEARERALFAQEHEQMRARLAAQRPSGAGPGGDVLSRAQSHYTRLGTEQDLSRLDYAVVCALTRDGYARDEIWTAIGATSPRLAERHPNITSYLTLTIDKAMAAAERDISLAGRRG